MLSDGGLGRQGTYGCSARGSTCAKPRRCEAIFDPVRFFSEQRNYEVQRLDLFTDAFAVQLLLSENLG